jgi:4'-phosphopantetheinyl transferase EntD
MKARRRQLRKSQTAPVSHIRAEFEHQNITVVDDDHPESQVIRRREIYQVRMCASQLLQQIRVVHARSALHELPALDFTRTNFLLPGSTPC